AMATKDAESVSAIEGQTDFGTSEQEEEPAETPGHQRGLNPIPFDENALKPFGPHPVPSDRWIESKSLPAKVFILSAGVLMNVVLALAVSTGTIKGFGRAELPAVVDAVVAGMPAMAAGLQRGDSVTAINGKPISRWNELLETVSISAGQPIELTIVRGGGELRTLTVTPTLSDDLDMVTGAPI